ncbi:MAG: hypothetical protein HYZ14_02410 [Bacteroidetes bacterium]|nr:hypothetical protein [Bacteroidota bacterium]
MKLDLGNINQLVCVTVQLNGDKTLFHYIMMKKTRGEITFGKMNKRIGSVEELVKEVSFRHPVLLHFTGKGILNRKIRREENYRHAILLNAQLDDFYFTDYLEEKTAYCSVIRRNTVHELLAEFAKHRLNVVGISSGPFVSVPLVPFFDKSSFVIDDIALTVEKDKVVSFEKREDPAGSINIGADRIDYDVLGSVALGANYFNPSDRVMLSVDSPVFMTNLEEARQKNIFFRFGKMLMIFFLTLLAANYFYLGHLNTKIEENFVVLSEFEDQLAMLSTLEEEKDRKENLLRSSGLLNRQFLSFYLMELSHSVPSEITFETITVRPLISEIKKKQKIEFYDHLIQISGRSKTSDLLSRWIDELKKEEWLSKVDIVDYTYARNAGNFKLEIVVE